MSQLCEVIYDEFVGILLFAVICRELVAYFLQS